MKTRKLKASEDVTCARCGATHYGEGKRVAIGDDGTELYCPGRNGCDERRRQRYLVLRARLVTALGMAPEGTTPGDKYVASTDELRQQARAVAVPRDAPIHVGQIRIAEGHMMRVLSFTPSRPDEGMIHRKGTYKGEALEETLIGTGFDGGAYSYA